MMDTVTLTITLPTYGTAFDYQQAISNAIVANSGNGIAQAALSGLMATIHTPPPARFNDGGERSTMVFGKL